MSDAQSFRTTVKDMVNDLLISFPELEASLDADLRAIRDVGDDVEESVDKIKLHCNTVFPKKFFGILYEHAEIFDVEDGSCEFLPGVDYAVLWKENLSDATRKTIWKYLQLLLFSSVSDVTDKSSFGETANLFSAVDDVELKTKLEETMAGMKSLFSDINSDEGKGPSLPDADEIHAHVSQMMGGKLGLLAKDIAEQTLNDMGEDFQPDPDKEGGGIEDIFAKLIRDPTKLMEMIKNVGTKLDEKIKSGELKESELLEEASGILKQMQSLPGMKDMKDLFKQMGVANMTGAQSSQAAAALHRKADQAKTRERMRAKLAQRQGAKLMEEALRMQTQTETDKPVKKKKKKKKKKKRGKNS